jgi:WD40 repeat protein/serine/threonine protein kinase
MANRATCARGHQWDSGPDQTMVCPECGAPPTAVASSAEIAETFRPVDELPPLPKPAPGRSWSTQMPTSIRLTTLLDTATPVLDGYEILEELGRGGMGVVYKARQIKLDRLVAIKMILFGADADPEGLARFHVEAEAVAQLQHPNIVQIHEISEQNGRSFLALEYIDGGSLATRLRGTPADGLVSARLVETVARAVHFAHGRGIVHRDLKPANILLAENLAQSRQDAKGKKNQAETDEAEPSYPRLGVCAALRELTPKIADFGLAKRLDRNSSRTRTGSILGTPCYMAPEQASAKQGAIGPATDVYALGAILYEMLTGRPPFNAATAVETVQQVLTQEPVPPRRLQPGVPRDLDTICLKCLAKEPDRRYASAEALADDLGRFLALKPILARPTPWWERTVKWIRRRKALSAALLLGALAVLASVAFGVGNYYHARLQESFTETDRLRRLNYRHHYLDEMNLAQRFWQDGHVPRVLALLNDHQKPQPGQADLRSFEWHYLWGLCHSDLLTYRGHKYPVAAVAFSPTANVIASASGVSTFIGNHQDDFGEVKLWEPDTGKTLFVLQGHTRAVTSLAFRRDGKQLATAGDDQSIRIWDVATGKQIHVLEGHSDGVTCIAVHPTKDWIASASRDRTIKIWDANAEKLLRTLTGHTEQVLSLAFSPSGERIVSGGGDWRKPDPGEIKVWNLAGGKEIFACQGHTRAVTCVAISPDGKWIASGSDDRTVKIWNAATGAIERTMPGHFDRITGVAFDPDGGRLASVSLDTTVKIWNRATEQELFSLKGHTDAVRAVAFDARGQRLATSSNDGTVKLWHADREQEFSTLMGHTDYVTCVAFSPDSKFLASAGIDHTVRLWDMAARKEIRKLIGHTDEVWCVAFNPIGNEVVSSSYDGSIRFWDLDTGKEKMALNPGGKIRSLAFSPDGTRLGWARSEEDFSKPAVVTVWDVSNKKEIVAFRDHASTVTSVAFSPDGRRIVSASALEKSAVKIWDAETGSELLSISLPVADDPRATFSPDGKRVAIVNGDMVNGQVAIHDVQTGNQITQFPSHLGVANAVAFSPDGERLVSTHGAMTKPSLVKLWDAQTGQDVLTLRGPAGTVQCLAFSPDGRWLAAAGGALQHPGRPGDICLWDARR